MLEKIYVFQNDDDEILRICQDEHSIIKLSDKIAWMINDKKVIILSSTAINSRANALVMANKLDIDYLICSELWSDTINRLDLAKATDRIMSFYNQADSLVLAINKCDAIKLLDSIAKKLGKTAAHYGNRGVLILRWGRDLDYAIISNVE